MNLQESIRKDLNKLSQLSEEGALVDPFAAMKEEIADWYNNYGRYESAEFGDMCEGYFEYIGDGDSQTAWNKQEWDLYQKNHGLDEDDLYDVDVNDFLEEAPITSKMFDDIRDINQKYLPDMDHEEFISRIQHGAGFEGQEAEVEIE